MSAVYVILALTTSCVTIVATYFLLNSEGASGVPWVSTRGERESRGFVVLTLTPPFTRHLQTTAGSGTPSALARPRGYTCLHTARTFSCSVPSASGGVGSGVLAFCWLASAGGCAHGILTHARPTPTLLSQNDGLVADGLLLWVHGTCMCCIGLDHRDSGDCSELLVRAQYLQLHLLQAGVMWRGGVGVGGAGLPRRHGVCAAAVNGCEREVRHSRE